MKLFKKFKKTMCTEQRALEALEISIGFRGNEMCYYCKGKDFEGNGPYYKCLVCKNKFTCISGSFIEESNIPALHWVWVISASYMYQTWSPILISEITGVNLMDVQSIIFIIDSLNGLEQ